MLLFHMTLKLTIVVYQGLPQSHALDEMYNYLNFIWYNCTGIFVLRKPCTLKIESRFPSLLIGNVFCFIVQCKQWPD